MLMNSSNMFCSALFQVLCNALWYITNQQQVIDDAALRKKEVLPVPPAFGEYTGFNQRARKKQKSLQMSAIELESHGQALYSLLMKPVANSSPAWVKASTEIKQLAECLMAYKEHLDQQRIVQTSNQELDHPVRTVGKDASLEHRNKTPFAVKHQFSLLDLAVRDAGYLVPVVFDESVHLHEPFVSNLQRYQFICNIQLSVPIDIIRYSPGGSCISTLCITQVSQHRTEPVILTQGARFLQQVQPSLKEFHTKAQRRMFKQSLTPSNLQSWR
jgi:hypothetical protein